MIDRSIRSGKKVVDEYIESLEVELHRRRTDGIEKLLKELDGVIGVCADDLNIIRNFKPEEGGLLEDKLVILSDKGADKLLERIVLLSSKIGDFQKIRETIKQMDADFHKEVEEQELTHGTPEHRAKTRIKKNAITKV